VIESLYRGPRRKGLYSVVVDSCASDGMIPEGAVVVCADVTH
jgi:hypothetical protein